MKKALMIGGSGVLGLCLGLVMAGNGVKGQALALAGLLAVPPVAVGLIVADTKAQNRINESERKASDALSKLDGITLKLSASEEREARLKVDLANLQQEFTRAKGLLKVCEDERCQSSATITQLQESVALATTRVDELEAEVEEWERTFHSKLDIEADKRFQKAKEAEIKRIEAENDEITREAMDIARAYRQWGIEVDARLEDRGQFIKSITNQYNAHLDGLKGSVSVQVEEYLKQIELLNVKVAALQQKLAGDLLAPEYGQFGFDQNGRIANAVAEWLWNHHKIPLKVTGFEVGSDGVITAGYAYSRSMTSEALARVIDGNSFTMARSLGLYAVEKPQKLQIADIFTVRVRRDRPARTPNAPDFSPVWGNVHDTHVQIEPLKLIVLADVFKELEIKTPPTLSALVDLTQPLAAPQPKALSAVELKALYKDKNVQPHRFALTEVKQLLNQPILSQSLMAPGSTGFLSELDINLAELIEQLSGDGDTSYEQLECVGLNPNQDTLAGIIRVKLSSGYSGGPCTAGSREYVTFWADFNNNGTFETYLGTTSVNVYDIDHIPEAGLEYAVFLPVDLNPYRQPCEDGPKVVRIRAILSWQDPPPSNNPNFIPIWGNREETLIHIKPGPAIPPGVQVPLLSAVGDISVPDINSSGLATGVGNFTGFVANNSPFGGKINLAGKIVNGTSASKYRVMRKPHGATDSAYVPLTNEPDGLVLTLITFNGGLTINTHYTIHADAEGYYTYQDYASNHYIESNILMRWFSTALEDGNAYDLRLDLSVDGNPAHDIHSNVVTVLIDNTAPDVALDIDLGTGVECADFNLGASFTGSYKVVDSHFGSFSFVIRPVGPAHGVLPVPPSGAYPSIADPGVPFGTYTLNTTGMAPCGYSLTLQAWDRTNVNSGSGNNYNEVSVGFCLLDLKPKPSV